MNNTDLFASAGGFIRERRFCSVPLLQSNFLVPDAFGSWDSCDSKHHFFRGLRRLQKEDRVSKIHS